MRQLPQGGRLDGESPSRASPVCQGKLRILHIAFLRRRRPSLLFPPCPFGPLVISEPGPHHDGFGVSPLCRMNDPGIVAAIFPIASSQSRRNPPAKPPAAEIAHTSQGGNFHITICHFSPAFFPKPATE